MKKTKSTPICSFEGCRKNCEKSGVYWSRFCSPHDSKVTIDKFLSRAYTIMKQRVNGKNTKRPDIYLGHPILPREVFYTWARNHPIFLSLYKQWFMSGFDRKLTPSVNRLHSSKGYTLDNMEWVTNSSNCGLSGAVRKMKNKKAIYDLLGVNK